jgi:predicted RNase H-like HicB family nuclease
MRVMEYVVVIEKSKDGFGAYIPDLPGCAVVGDTVEETRRLIESAVVMHLEAMRKDGDAIPEPTTTVDYVEI